MRDLEILSLEVKNGDSRRLFEESVRSYRSGAHRAAIISLWVSVAYDIVSKFRILGETGNGSAGSLVADLDRYIENNNYKKLQEFERNLLDSARSDEVQVINDRDYVELERLRMDRNICAHPAFVDTGQLYSPSAEYVRAHMASAVDRLLSQPAISGKQLKETLSIELRGSSWPQGSAQKSADYMDLKYLKDVSSDARLGILKVLIKWCVQPEDGDSKMLTRSRHAYYGIRDRYPMLTADAMGIVLGNWESAGRLDDETLLMVAGAFAGSEEFWTRAPDAVTTRAVARVGQASTEDLMRCGFFTGIEPNSRVSEKYFENIREMEYDTLSLVVAEAISATHLIDSLIKRLEVSPGFRSAENDLNLLINCAPDLDAPKVVRIREAIEKNGRNHTINQVVHAGKSEDILIDIFKNGPLDPDSVQEWCKLAKFLDEYGNDDESWETNYESLLSEVRKRQ
ncbi:hypothetical protein [Kocuria palustris]|uniref:hypothetical protein n=1 Tax=Kocuria palustris TaxID=71999 RepID=UPI0023015297|nr:hypothetical protein [Kocuria palustris]